MDKKAFTLAEVLIVLGIIGVVAALTIPTLMQNAQEHALVSGLLKFDTELHQAVAMWKNDIECQDSAGKCLAEQKLIDNNITNFDQIAKYMKIIKKCTGGDCSKANWLPDNTLNYYGDNSTASWGKVAKVGYSAGAFMLTDGMTFSVDTDSAGLEVTVDVNGSKKPNRMGKDTFKIRIGDLSSTSLYCTPKDICYNQIPNIAANGKGLCGCKTISVTTGVCNNCNPNNVDPTKDNGAMPTSYVLINHKLPDFKALSKTVSGFKP